MEQCRDDDIGNSESAVKDYSTSDLQEAAFLHSRGFEIKRMTKKYIDGQGQVRKAVAVFWFCERSVVMRALLEFINNKDSRKYNVNAQSFLQSLDRLRTMARNC